MLTGMSWIKLGDPYIAQIQLLSCLQLPRFRPGKLRWGIWGPWGLKVRTILGTTCSLSFNLIRCPPKLLTGMVDFSATDFWLSSSSKMQNVCLASWKLHAGRISTTPLLYSAGNVDKYCIERVLWLLSSILPWFEWRPNFAIFFVFNCTSVDFSSRYFRLWV